MARPAGYEVIGQVSAEEGDAAVRLADLVVGRLKLPNPFGVVTSQRLVALLVPL
jgi:hypothetical protein